MNTSSHSTAAPAAAITSAGGARDQLNIGLDLIRTCHNACYQEGGCDKDDFLAIASSLEQAMKLFVNPVRDWLSEENIRETNAYIARGRE